MPHARDDGTAQGKYDVIDLCLFTLSLPIILCAWYFQLSAIRLIEQHKLNCPVHLNKWAEVTKSKIQLRKNLLVKIGSYLLAKTFEFLKASEASTDFPIPPIPCTITQPILSLMIFKCSWIALVSFFLSMNTGGRGGTPPLIRILSTLYK